MVKAHKVLGRWSASYRWGGYWHLVERNGRIVYYGSAATARAAAQSELDSLAVQASA